MTPVAAVEGKRGDDDRGLSAGGLHAVQRAWIEADVVQCGYCQPGQIMAAAGLLAAKPDPTDADIDAALSGEPLPLRDVPAHPRGDPSRRRAGREEGMSAPLTPTSGINRRRFLKTSAGLVIGFTVAPRTGLPALQAPAAEPLPDPNAFLRIGTDESVTVLLAHSEMGQGIWTTLPMLLAEELGCDWTKVRVEHAPAAPAYAHTAYGMQMTGGSTTTWSNSTATGRPARWRARC